MTSLAEEQGGCVPARTRFECTVFKRPQILVWTRQCIRGPCSQMGDPTFKSILGF